MDREAFDENCGKKEKPMKPEIALKLQYLLDKYTREQIETIRDEWIAAYREIAESDSSKEELCDSLTDRINRAAELFIRRHIEPVVSDAISHDDYYYTCSANVYSPIR